MQKILFIFLSLFLLACEGETEVHYPAAAENGLDDQALYRAVQAAEDDGGILSLVLKRRGELIFEEYFGKGGEDVYHPVMSVTKSVTGMIIGKAIMQGYIGSVDETVGDYLSGFLNPEDSLIARVKIRHLLSMSGGFDWDELTDPEWEDWNNWVRSDNHLIHALHVPVIHEPGSYFTYTTAGCQILSGIISAATGKNLGDYADEVLFTPLGIPAGRPWSYDQNGYHYGGVALNLTARDMMKLGDMFLNGGVWEGRQILPASWVKASTGAQISSRDRMLYASSYGFLWWIGSHNGHDYYYANGWGGQFIIVYPDLEMIVVAQSELDNDFRSSPEQWVNTINLIMGRVLGAVD